MEEERGEMTVCAYRETYKACSIRRLDNIGRAGYLTPTTKPSDPLGPVPVRILQERAQDLATSLQTKKKIGTPTPGSHEWEGRAKRTNLEERVSSDDAEEALEALSPGLDDLV
jgi:hypothetical protein